MFVLVRTVHKSIHQLAPTPKVRQARNRSNGRCCSCRRSSPESMGEAAEPKPIRIFCARTRLCPSSCCRSTLARMIGTHHHPRLGAPPPPTEKKVMESTRTTKGEQASGKVRPAQGVRTKRPAQRIRWGNGVNRPNHPADYRACLSTWKLAQTFCRGLRLLSLAIKSIVPSSREFLNKMSIIDFIIRCTILILFSINQLYMTRLDSFNLLLGLLVVRKIK